MKYAELGTISFGTLVTSDLIARFANELEAQYARNPEMLWEPEHEKLVKHANALYSSKRTETQMDEDGAETLRELSEALDTFAAPYCYFGTLEGDGADFGFWISSDAIGEAISDGDLERISDPSEVIPGKECLFINDHGNMTLYDAQGNVVWEVV